MLRIIYFFVALLFITSCGSDKSSSSQDLDEINIRLYKDPNRINPFYSPTSIGREVYQYIFLPMADFDPESLQLRPILIEEIPKGYEHTLEDGRKTIAYDVSIKNDAQWSDGKPITNEDYLFTVNLIHHPESTCTGWKSYFSNIYEVELDDNNPKKFTVYANPNYMLSLETAVTTCLIPSHVFDRQKILDEKLETDSATIKIVQEVNASMNAKKDVVQSGPYRLTDFQTDEFIILSQIENYWGAAYPDNPFLQANAKKFIFKIVPDQLAAINMAKENALDVLTLQSSNIFLDARKDSVFSADWNFFTPQLMFYYYIALNHTSPKLSDPKVRRALAHLIDVDDFIEVMDGGLGVRSTGHFHPTKSYYNDKLPLIPFDIAKANALLDEAGWNKNGEERSKQINGKTEKLNLDFIITGSPLSKNLALIFQEGAAKAGVNINIITKKTSVARKENLSTYNYDMIALAQGMDASADDPYSKWHSDNIGGGKRNESAYNNPLSDELIEKIRTTRDPEIRKEYYLKLQELMYNDQANIFLYSPLIKILVNKNLESTATPKRPGYLANTFKLKK